MDCQITSKANFWSKRLPQFQVDIAQSKDATCIALIIEEVGTLLLSEDEFHELHSMINKAAFFLTGGASHPY